VNSDRRAVGRHDDRGIDSPDRAAGRLDDRPDFHDRLDVARRGAVKSRWFGAVEFDPAIVDAQAREGREEVLDECDARGRGAERRAPPRVGHERGVRRQ
jgi:hypothetical protein